MNGRLHGDAEMIFRAGLSRVDSRKMMQQVLQLQGSRLTVDVGSRPLVFDLDRFKRVLVTGVGKATARMALGLAEVLDDRIDGGLIVVKTGHTESLPSTIECLEASHPVPDESSVRAASRLLDYCKDTGAENLVISLISGGGSSLAALPAPGLTLADKQGVTRALLSCGASIHEINAIRKHLSAIKGGRLACALHPATSLNLILSDVIGDDLDTIASGMTAPDSSTFQSAWGIIEKYQLETKLPAPAVKILRDGLDGRIPETPKPGNAGFQKVSNVIVGSNLQAVQAAGEKARELGYTPILLTSALTGEAREMAKFFLAATRDAEKGVPARPPFCLIAGGETTVTLRGKGKGGRNQEMALAFLQELGSLREPLDNLTFLSASTDGNDGPTDAAGAFASTEILARARNKGLSIQDYLDRNDSYHFFEAVDGLIKTGPTNTNVCDLQILLVNPL